jgi:beta-xylosidase
VLEFQIDLASAKSGPRLLSGDLGYDEYAGTLSPLGYANLLVLKEAPKGTFRYIRIHNIFTSEDGDGRGSRDAGGNPVRIDIYGEIYYDWSVIDAVCQTILEIECIPFLELGFTPTLWSSIGKSKKFRVFSKVIKLVARDPPCSYPPTNIVLWENLLREFFTHIREKFGNQIQKWPVELWNEPDILYFKGTIEDYCRLWEISYRVIRKFEIQKFGGPGVARTGTFFVQFLKFCEKKHLLPDFISYHVKGGSGIDNFANIALMRNHLLHGLATIPHSLRHIPIWITEFDPIVGCEKGIPDGAKWAFHNKNYYASWLGKCCYMLTCLQQNLVLRGQNNIQTSEPLKIAAIFNDAHHITAESKTFYGARCLSTPIWIQNPLNTSPIADPLPENAYDSFPRKIYIQTKEVNPSMSVMMKDLDSRQYCPKNTADILLTSLPKPIFRAMEYTRYLIGKYIPFSDHSTDIYGTVALDGIQLTFCIAQHNDRMDIGADCSCIVKVKLPGFSKIQLLESIRIDEEAANPFALWQQIGSPAELTIKQFQQLKIASQVKPALLSEIKVEQGKFSFLLMMKSHSFNCIRFTLE